jgi:RimJ/RimL family protein N-acetyltransferase
VANEWAEKGRGARVEVRIGNTASLRLCAKLGFRQIEESRLGYMNLLRPLEVAQASRAAMAGT